MQYASQPLSRHQIRIYAKDLRKSLGLDEILYFPVTELLEQSYELFKDKGFDYEIVEDHELPHNIHAHYDCEANTIRIKNSVYTKACNGSGQDRMTITHEISHFLIITHSGVVLNRIYNNATIPTYCDPEWQAKCLAGELMIPAHLVKGMSAKDVSLCCGVSEPAASYQLSKIK